MRTLIFQWITNIYPTNRIYQSKSIKNIYRLLIEIIRPRGKITTNTGSYRFQFRLRPKKNLAWQMALKGPYEPYETEVFRNLIRPSMTIVDIGANIGHYSIIGAKMVGAQGKVFAFEPVPDIFSELRSNLSLNGITNVIPIKMAVGCREETKKIFIDEDNSGGHSFSRDNVAINFNSIEIEIATLDSLRRNNFPDRSIDFIKMDTQGAEGEIIAGAKESLRSFKPIILMEFWPFGMQNFEFNAEDTLKTLSELGYAFQLVDELKHELIDATIADLLTRFPVTDRNQYGNILARAAA